MKKIYLFIFIISIANSVLAQKFNVVNASIALRQDNLVEAKQYIDEAFLNDATSNDPKMWNYRAPIYLQIAQKQPELDDKAVIKSTIAHIKCLQIGKKNKIIVKKWTTKKEILDGLNQCGYLLFNQALENYNNKNFKNSITLYEKIFEIIPYDEENLLKRNNITVETILYNSIFAAKGLNNSDKLKEILLKLMNLNYNDPIIYKEMYNVFLNEGDTLKAIEYMSLGRELFDTDQQLILDEINLYIQLDKTIELIDKLTLAIKSDSENETLLNVRGTVYFNIEDYLNSEKDFLKILSLDSESFDANYMLGSIEITRANIIITKKNITNDNNLYEKLVIKEKLFYSKSLSFYEKALLIKPKDKSTLEALKQIYYKLNFYKKSEDMKRQISLL